MAASSSDYFMKTGFSTATTLSSPGYTTGATSINVASTANLPTGTGIYIMIDEVDADGERISGTYNVFRGVVSSATQISSLVYAGGDANRNYSAGATTRVYMTISSYHTNRMVDGILISIDQDGTLKAGAVDNTAVIADGIVTNAKLSTSSGEPGAFTSWTPTLSGRFTDGDWTKSCKYTKIGKSVTCKFSITSTDATPMAGGSGGATFTLPVTAAALSSTSNVQVIGQVHLWDASSGNTTSGAIFASIVLTSTTTATIRALDDTASGVAGAELSSTIPFTWSTSDEIAGTFTYEAA